MTNTRDFNKQKYTVYPKSNLADYYIYNYSSSEIVAPKHNLTY